MEKARGKLISDALGLKPVSKPLEKCWDDGWLWNPKTYSFDRILRLESGRMILQGSVYQPKELE